MAQPQGCIDRVLQAVNNELTAKDVTDILEAMNARREQMIADGVRVDIPGELRRSATAAAKDARIKKAIERRNTVLAAMKREGVLARLRSWQAAGVSRSKSLLMLFEGTVRNIEEGRFSITAQRLGLEGRYIGRMFAELDKADPSIIAEMTPGLRDDVIMAGRAVGLIDRNTPLSPTPFLDDVVREMHALRNGKAQGATKNKRAAMTAEIFWKYSEMSRRDLNRWGANIGSLEGWSGPQMHDSERMMRVTEKEWVDAILPRLDLKRTFEPLGVYDEVRAAVMGARGQSEIRYVLGQVYRTLTTGRDMEITPAERGQTTGPANLASQLGKHRVLHFKSADDWLTYNREFGHGHILNGILGHQKRAAQVGALMSVLGPNPRAMIERVAIDMEKEIRNDTRLSSRDRRRQINQLNVSGWSAIGSALDIAIGQSAVNMDFAKWGRFARAMQSMAKLGGTVFTSFTDVPAAAANAFYRGQPLGKAYADQVLGAVKGKGKGFDRQLLYLTGEGFDGLADDVVTPYAADDGAPGAMQLITSRYFKWSMLTNWTDRQRGAAGRAIVSELGQNAGRQWDSLNPKYRRVLKQHGIDGKRWELIRSTAYVAENGRRYITPEKLADVPDEALTPFVKDRLEQLEAGLSEREARRAAADVQEKEWIARRTERLGLRLGEARDRLQKHKGQLELQSGTRIRDLENRLGDIEGSVADLREIYLGTRPASAELRHRLAADTVAQSVNLIDEIGNALRAADPETGTAWKQHAGPILKAVEAIEMLASEKPPTVRAVAEKLGLAMDSIREARTTATISPDAPRLLDDLYDGFELAAIHIEPGPAPRDVGRQEGRAGARIAKLRKQIEGVKRQMDKTRDVLDTKFIERWQRREAELLEFIERSEARAARRKEQAQQDSAQHKANVARVYDDARFDLEMNVRRFIADEVNFGIIESDPVMQRMTTLGQPAGTKAGEAARIIMQFKGYPLMFASRVLGRAILGTEGIERAGQLGVLIAGLTVAGYAGQTVKDALRGYGPRDPRNWKTWMAAASAGGGLGIYGDFLFGEYNRFGNSTLETLAGPTVGTFVDMVQLYQAAREGEARGRAAMELILQNTPFVNIWFAKAAMDYTILNDIREALSPGFRQRQERTRKQQYGQQPLADLVQ